jgi:hypothetical protein
MGRIKSALEIALERTEGVKSDKSSIEQFEAKQRGKRLANAFLEDPARGIADELKKTPPQQRDSFRQGIFEVLIARITLPLAKEDMPPIEAACRGLEALISNHRFSMMIKQLAQAFTQYLEESAHYEGAIRQQYAPKLRQKEEELARRMGRQVRLDPLQDPEFVAFYNQNMNALKAGYLSAIDQVREEARRLFDGAA